MFPSLRTGILGGLLVLGAAVGAGAAAAQVPQMLHYQATLTEGDRPVDDTVDLEFAFYADSSGGTPLAGWTETRSNVTLVNGRINLLLGRQTPLPVEVFEGDRRYLEVRINGESLHRFRLASSAYALHAAVADSMGAESVPAEALVEGAVGRSALADGAVHSGALADEAVVERTIAPSAVTGSALAAEAVTTNALAENAVTREKLETNAVGSNELADGAVNSSQLSTGAVTAEKVDRGQLVTSLNTLTDDVRLVEGEDVTIRSNEEEGTITISASGGLFSSRRWKTDIRPLRDALPLVQQLQGVRYRWEETGEPDIGLIAEEVEGVVPEVVTYSEDGGQPESIEYARLVALLIEAVKTQQEQLEAEREALDALERRIEALERRAGSGGGSGQ